MNKFNLFAIIGIVSAFTTALIFGSMVTPGSAQENMTMTMDNMSNMSTPMNNMSNMTMTMESDSVVIGEPRVAPPQVAPPQVGEESSDSGEEESSDSGEEENEN
jgi:hypothetical protein